MKCTYFQRNMPDYLEKQLTPAQIKRFENHLRHCEPCRYDLELLQQSIPLIKEQPKISASYQLQIQLKQMVAAKPFPSSRKFGFNYTWLLGLIYGLMLLVILTLPELDTFFQYLKQHLNLITFIGIFIILICAALLIMLRQEIAELEN